jgi:glycosyltransferase involved in cell wall biosynthesis
MTSRRPTMQNECGRTTLDVIVSVYNEESALPAFHAELSAVISRLQAGSVNTTITYVNDGSTDQSSTLLDGFATEPGVRAIHLSRNFGHEAAMLAGLDECASDYAVFLDADLQHPPGVIPEALALARAGHEVVLMRRAEPPGRTLRRTGNAIFYRGLAAIASLSLEPDASDFFLVARPVVEVLQREIRERTRFLRGLVQWVGFRRAVLTFTAAPRVAGRSKYRFGRLVSLARDATLAFSTAPLRIAFIAACIMLLGSLATAAVTFGGWLLGDPPSGYSTIMIFSTFTAAAQFAMLGILGEYVGQLVDEAKGRPVYIVARRNGLPLDHTVRRAH